MAPVGAGGNDPPAGGLLLELRHDDACISRFSDDSVYFRLTRDRERGASVVLDEGASWHVCRCDRVHRVWLPFGMLALRGTTAVAVCLPDGRGFVGAISGDVAIKHQRGERFLVPESGVAVVGPTGCELLDPSALESVVKPAWINSNRELDRQLISAPPPDRPARRAGAPLRLVGETDSAEAARHRQPSALLAWLLVASVFVATGATALTASLMNGPEGSTPRGPTPVSGPSASAPRPGSTAGPTPTAPVTSVPRRTIAVPGPTAGRPPAAPVTSGVGSPLVGLPAAAPELEPTACSRLSYDLAMDGVAISRSGGASTVQILVEFFDARGRTIASAEGWAVVPAGGQTAWRVSTTTGAAPAVIGCRLDHPVLVAG